MTAEVLMVIIMLSADGQASSSFVEVESHAACTDRLDRIRPILESGEQRLVFADCRPSKARFTAFDHNPPADAPRHVLYLDTAADEVMVTAFPSRSACLEQLPAGRDASFCTSSVQSILEPVN